MKPRPLTPDEKAAWRDVVSVIDSELRLKAKDGDPRLASKPGDRWTWARDFSIYARLCRGGVKPDELIGAIPFVRTILEGQDGPMTMRVFNGKKNGTPILEQAIGIYRKRQATKGEPLSAKLDRKRKDDLRRVLGL